MSKRPQNDFAKALKQKAHQMFDFWEVTLRGA